MNDKLPFEELLKKDGSFSIHHRNIQAMAIEMYKTKNTLGPTLLYDIFTLNECKHVGLRSNSDFSRPSVNTVHFGKDSLAYFGSVIWYIIPTSIKNSDSLISFKKQIRNWCPNECPCRLCQVYLHRLGYTNIV